MKSLLITLALLSGCNLKNVNRATLALSSAMLACDWGQTRSAASEGWGKRWEANPIMGRQPSTQTVDLYFTGVIALNTAIWLVMPKKLKSVIPGVVIGAQAHTIHGNLETTSGTCGI